MIRSALVALTLCLLAGPTAAQTVHAQPAASIDSATARRLFSRLRGDRVRVGTGSAGTVVPGVTVSGRLLDSRGDTLVIRNDADGSPVEVVVGASVRVEKWVSANHAKAYAVLGSLAGIFVGGAIGQAVNDPPPRIVTTCRADNFGEALGCALGSGIANGLNEAADEIGAIVAGAFIGSVALGVAGSIIGNTTAFEGWRAVNPLRFQARRRPGGQVDVGFEIVR